jgi:hypothetical protein
MVQRTRQQVQRDLIDSASGLCGQASQLSFEFGRNLQVHKASVGRTEGSVNRLPSAGSPRFHPWPTVCVGEWLTPPGGRDTARWLALAFATIEASALKVGALSRANPNER